MNDILDKISEEIQKEMIKSFQRKINQFLKQCDHEQIAMSALGNAFICLSIKAKVEKEEFMSTLSEAWDYHASE